MPDARPRRRAISSSRLRAELAETLALTDHHLRVLVERRGRKPVAIISLDDLQKLELFEREAQSRQGAA